MGVQADDAAVVVELTHPAADSSEAGGQPFGAESVSEEGVVSLLTLTRIPKYSSTQTLKYPNTHILKYSNTQIPNYPNTQIPKYPNTQIPKN